MKRISFLLCTVLLFVCGSAVFAQTDTRTEPTLILSYSLASQLVSSTLPSSINVADLRTFNTFLDANDPVHSCRSGTPHAGSYSVFARITHPGGTLTISTSGSGFDTVLSVFNAPAGVPFGASVACSDDYVGNTSAISQILPAGSYVVMVSRYNILSPSDSALNLVLAMGYSPIATVPINDVHTLPMALTTGKALIESNVHYATDNATEMDLNDACEMYNSVWYSFTAPDDGQYIFTTYGSSYSSINNVTLNYASVAVYTTNLGFMFECQTGGAVAAATIPLGMNEGSTYLVRVGIPSNVNVLPGSQYKIKALAISSAVIKTNTSFALGNIGWTTKNWDGGDTFSNGYARFNAGTQKKTLTQSRSIFPSHVKFAKGGVLELAGHYNYLGTATGKLTLKVVYSDGKPTQMINVPLLNSTSAFVRIPVILTSKAIKSISVSAILNAGGGLLEVDYLYAQYTREGTALRIDAVLPLPLALPIE